MQSNIPKPVAVLLDLIASVEAPKGYDTVYGNKQGGMKKKITQMTLNEVIADGPRRTREYGSSACGRYQFMTNTLKDIKTKLKQDGKRLFDASYQDELGWYLLLRRGYTKWSKGSMSDEGFMLGLAKEWASFPDPKTGQSFYAGDGKNKVLISVSKVKAGLEKAKSFLQAPEPTPVPVPEPPVIGPEIVVLTAEDFIVALEEFIKEWRKQAMVNPAVLSIGANVVNSIVSGLINNPSIPVRNEDAPKVTAVVRKEIDPVINHLTNNEPWYRSRVTWGAIISVLSTVAPIAGVQLGAEDQEAMMAGVGAVGVLIGAATTLYGRWVARKPIGR